MREDLAQQGKRRMLGKQRNRERHMEDKGEETGWRVGGEDVII